MEDRRERRLVRTWGLIRAHEWSLPQRVRIDAGPRVVFRMRALMALHRVR